MAVELAPFFQLVGSTPEQVNQTPPSEIGTVVEATVRSLAAMDFDDFASQLQAMLAHDVADSFDGDLSRAARAFRARLLVVFSPDDHVVTPQPAASFAALLGADTLSVRSACGHGVFGCEASSIVSAVRAFLMREP